MQGKSCYTNSWLAREFEKELVGPEGWSYIVAVWSDTRLCGPDLKLADLAVLVLCAVAGEGRERYQGKSHLVGGASPPTGP